MPIKFYSDRSHYHPESRAELIPLLRAYWKDAKDYSEQDRINEFGLWVSNFQVTDRMKDADIAVLPMSWNYYYQTANSLHALMFIETCQKSSLPVVTFTSGDLGAAPAVTSVWLLSCGGYRSSKRRHDLGMPVFFDDPLKKYFKKDSPRRKSTKPVVGFCGQAHSPLYRTTYDLLRNVYRNLLYYSGLSKNLPQTLYPATLRRSRIIGGLQRSTAIETNFIIRKSYRAGSKTKTDKEATSQEYFENMAASDYIVCVRGNGNFSVRLYETLAMGRIPVIIDTDCIYPVDHKIEWRKMGVWVDSKNIRKLPELISLHYHSLSPIDFQEIQEKCRKKWESYLTLGSYVKETVDWILQMKSQDDRVA